MTDCSFPATEDSGIQVEKIKGTTDTVVHQVFDRFLKLVLAGAASSSHITQVQFLRQRDTEPAGSSG
jgi:hypothetical protein